jgi:hypothetical protein
VRDLGTCSVSCRPLQDSSFFPRVGVALVRAKRPLPPPGQPTPCRLPYPSSPPSHSTVKVSRIDGERQTALARDGLGIRELSGRTWSRRGDFVGPRTLQDCSSGHALYVSNYRVREGTLRPGAPSGLLHAWLCCKVLPFEEPQVVPAMPAVLLGEAGWRTVGLRVGLP